MNGELAKQYYGSRTVELPHPSARTAQLVRYAHAALRAIFRFGYEYQKVGVMLTGLVPADFRQANLFNQGPDDRQIRLARIVDKLNYRYGRDKVRLASAGYDPSWHHKRQWMSPRYTTQWKDILIVK
jgi:DNA polymerase V